MLTLISDDELLNLPDDPELAFVQYERTLRDKLHTEINESGGYNEQSLQLEYINHVIAAVKALELNILSEWMVPKVNENISRLYDQFCSDVDHFTVQIRFKHVRRIKYYSIALDPTTKQKIRHHLTKIKEIVDRLEVPDKKREAFYSRIAALESEVDRDRTRYDAVMALILETADTSKEVVQRVKPVRKFIDSITALLKEAKDEEDKTSPGLPAPSERKRIEGPRNQPVTPETEEELQDLDDEIPF